MRVFSMLTNMMSQKCAFLHKCVLSSIRIDFFTKGSACCHRPWSSCRKCHWGFINYASFTKAFSRKDVINGYENIVTSTIDYVYTFYGSEIIPRTEDEESIAQVYNQFVNANHVIFKIIYYKADLFEGHGYVGEDLTKALRKLEGVYDVS